MRLMETGPITYLRYNILLPSNLSIIAESIRGPLLLSVEAMKAPSGSQSLKLHHSEAKRDWWGELRRRATLLSDQRILSCLREISPGQSLALPTVPSKKKGFAWENHNAMDRCRNVQKKKTNSSTIDCLAVWTSLDRSSNR